MLQISQFPADPGDGAERETERAWAQNDPADEPVHFLYHEEPKGGAVQLSP